MAKGLGKKGKEKKEGRKERKKERGRKVGRKEEKERVGKKLWLQAAISPKWGGKEVETLCTEHIIDLTNITQALDYLLI